MKTTVIYHKADFDGIFCREIAKKFLPGAELIGWDYGDSEPVVSEEDPLYILDLSVHGLMNHPGLVWIDHHKTAIEKYESRTAGYRIDGVAACRLAWQWFSIAEHNAQNSTNEQLQVPLPSMEDFIARKVSEPIAVRLAGEYDIWDKRDPRAELFQHGLRSRELSDADWIKMLTVKKPTMEEFEQLAAIGVKNVLETDGSMLPSIVRELLEAGKVLQYSRSKENESIIKSSGFTVQFEGRTLLACNAARYNSQLFAAGLKPEHEGCIGFNWDGKQWRVSLYSDKPGVDLSPIAVKYGGGGHPGACGFRCDKLPFIHV